MYAQSAINDLGEDQNWLRQTAFSRSPAEPALMLRDGTIERPVMNVVRDRAVVQARAGRRGPATDQALEEYCVGRSWFFIV